MTMAEIYNNFEKQQQKQQKEYIALGIDELTIRELYLFDKQQLARNIAYNRRSTPLEKANNEDNDTPQNSTDKNITNELTVEIDLKLVDRYLWTAEISDNLLIQKINKLSNDDLELLTLFAIEKYTQREIATKLNVSQKNICKKITKIKKILK